MKFRQQVERWLQATVLSSLKAGAVALKAYSGVAIGAALGSNLGLQIPSMTPQQLAVIFLTAAFWHFNDCLAGIPLETETQVPSSKIQTPTQS